MRVAFASSLCIAVCSFLAATAHNLNAAEETDCLREARALPTAIKTIDYTYSRAGTAFKLLSEDVNRVVDSASGKP